MALTLDDIVDIMTTKVRCLTLSQIARTAFQHSKNPQKSAHRWLCRQEAAQLLAIHFLPVHPELLLDAPLLDYRPGDPQPSFDAIAWRARSRWKPPIISIVATATKRALGLNGGFSPRPLRLCEVTHDVEVASIYLRFLLEDPALAARWVHEDAIQGATRSHFGGKVPDAIVTGTDGMIVEFVGKYSAKKLRSLAADYSASGRYQLW